MLDLVHPPACILCEEPLGGLPLRPPSGPWLCDVCFRRAPLVATPCRRCSSLDDDPRLVRCPLCRPRLPPLPLRHAGWHRDALRELVLAAKWHGLEIAVPLLAKWAVDAAISDGWTSGLDGWCAVPRDPLRWLLHGQALAEHLGAEIGRRLGLPRIPPPRRRVRRPQARLGAAHRRRNLEDAFSARRSPRLRDRHLLLVDDVMTTGSTLAGCGAALLRAGAADVRALVIAAAPLERPRG